MHNRYRFAASEISALVGRHYCRPANEAKIGYIQRRHPWMKPLLPGSVPRTTAVVPKAVQERLKTETNISDKDLAALASEVTVITEKKENTVAPVMKETPKLLQDLKRSPPKKKRKRNIQKGALNKFLGKEQENDALAKYCRQTGESIVEEQPWLDKTFVTKSSKIPYRIVGRADFIDSGPHVCEIKTRVTGYKYPDCDVDQCCLYSVMTGYNARLVQQNRGAGPSAQVMVSDVMTYEDMMLRWTDNIKPKLDAFVEELEECYKQRSATK